MNNYNTLRKNDLENQMETFKSPSPKEMLESRRS